ncbi:MOSC domain-containing protein [Thiohalophilus thiocyanatoxydans]|uniref:MOSC domain-containing protein n=1 Tax=Thiohalophilus thiocyanatoxydans TaxID=381308 RepID=A0A4R8IG50_9GAMM|nr:MOSC domain-containing protein [Thiohalophilus thiocyanatoxydans]TDX99535.1 MOSC domain-containing protein [Thiohalophilus thiocyanatoxydans]
MSLFNKLFPLSRNRALPQLKAIYIAGSAGAEMQSVDRIQALEQTGLGGDRYSVARGYWQVTEACQVTLISEDDLDKAKKKLSEPLCARLDTGHHRRNLVISHLKTRDLHDKTFRIGGAIFRYHKPRPPCGYLDKIEGKGLGGALGKNSGICVTVISGGVIAVGDRVEIVPD